VIYLATMKLARCLSDSCQAFAAHALARGLRLHPNATRGAVAAFSSASHRLAVQSHDESLAKPLLIPPEERATLLRWPAHLRAVSGEGHCPCTAPQTVPGAEQATRAQQRSKRVVL
jgi:hypothetical protein